MRERDCNFTRDHNWFHYRVGAIIIEGDCVLMAGNEKMDYLYSVGGGVHMGETAEEAVIREVYEETGTHYEIERLVFIHENFFQDAGTTEGMACHEISLYFLMKPRGSKVLNSESYCTEGKEFMHWIPLKELANYKAYPDFFKEKLMNLPTHVEHIITKDIDMHNQSTNMLQKAIASTPLIRF